jgi:hypothetical protein
VLRFRASLTRMNSGGDDVNVEEEEVNVLELTNQMNAVGQLKKIFYSLDLDRSNTVTMEELVQGKRFWRVACVVVVVESWWWLWNLGGGMLLLLNSLNSLNSIDT